SSPTSSAGGISSGPSGAVRSISGATFTRVGVKETLLTANRMSYITGTAERPRRSSLSATAVIAIGAACAAITGRPTLTSLNDDASRNPANTTTKPHKNVAAIKRKPGSMVAHLNGTPAPGGRLHS